MQVTLEIYRDRITEIELYFSSLKQLYASQHEAEIRYDYYSDDFLKMLKANALLMVYNLVESSIMGGIMEIYDKMKSSGYSYNNVTKEIKDIWFCYKFNQVYDKSAQYNSYKEKAMEIITSIMSGEVISLDKNATNISGNLNAAKIREICKVHGITYSIDKSCRGGIVLDDVKNKRNELAHGTISFVECGREYSMESLTQIKVETVKYLEGILAGMEKYYNYKLYLCV
ncbi:hypothetical protein K2F43_19720 [Clostridium estertheticum]|uniref:MAE_28990/MAE_18760 family HEPN-like nuclease n=1 Tax=Clostridium estertheticum TaxID=238834 RepID=UPI001C6EFB91|nr:MAE_28990/MAE_18760 family HEPN-like nuclease [Clostridium estertheticum]MBW9173420.1 hypothetical protein [Clostridium estertheticum]WLC76577.1 hypothetical protein KTC99_07205 [Clostridium estertheticum]